MFNEPKVIFVDVFDNGILRQADEGSKVVPVDDCPRASLPELCCSLNTHREVESCAEESMVRSRVELRNNTDVGQAKPSIEDDVGGIPNDDQLQRNRFDKIFEAVVRYFDAQLAYIPLELVLGFFCTQVFYRWNKQYDSVGFIDKYVEI
ncbi:hypothetical protein TELCIR_06573 [Teladorsagia circumcincta]|uniref:Bestrophin homolog n=1 Tax=Teladorsagia circumcincta TaxID=45464 RepID=A0A2G9UMJ9_TELCI|nr:hypothetical protein TELCIR_06573 [Teladorsagia circumcincta]